MVVTGVSEGQMAVIHGAVMPSAVVPGARSAVLFSDLGEIAGREDCSRNAGHTARNQRGYHGLHELKHDIRSSDNHHE